MTGQAGGDQSASTIEVMLGNLVGTFLSPALLQMFLSTSNTWAFGSPVASGKGGTGEIYRQVIEQLGCTVFVPLFVGEVIQYLIPVFVKKWRLKLKLAKVGSFCLLLVIWSVSPADCLSPSASLQLTRLAFLFRSTFSNAFHSGAFKAVSGNTIAFVVVVNLLLYVFFSLFLFAIARSIPMPRFLRDSKYRHLAEGDLSHWEEKKLFDVQTTIPLLFCGAAKGECRDLRSLLGCYLTEGLFSLSGIVLGGPVVQILYGGLSELDRGIVTIPVRLSCCFAPSRPLLTETLLRPTCFCPAARPLPRLSSRRRPGYGRHPQSVGPSRQSQERAPAAGRDHAWESRRRQEGWG